MVAIDVPMALRRLIIFRIVGLVDRMGIIRVVIVRYLISDDSGAHPDDGKDDVVTIGIMVLGNVEIVYEAVADHTLLGYHVSEVFLKERQDW